MVKARIATAAVLVAVVALGGCGAGAPATVHEQARQIEGQVWSPYCPGRLLSDCTTRQAFELRDTIEERLESGDDPEEVLAWFRANYGEEMLARPDGSATGLVIWFLPLALLFTAAGLAAGLVRRWSRTQADPAGAPVVEDEWVARVRDEVRRDL